MGFSSLMISGLTLPLLEQILTIVSRSRKHLPSGGRLPQDLVIY